MMHTMMRKLPALTDVTTRSLVTVSAARARLTAGNAVTRKPGTR